MLINKLKGISDSRKELKIVLEIRVLLEKVNTLLLDAFRDFWILAKQIVIFNIVSIIGVVAVFTLNYFFPKNLLFSLILLILSILPKLLITVLIQDILKQAKQKSIIKAEEPLDDFEHVKDDILGKDSQFLAKVTDFTDKKILNYPLINLQNRSQVYAIDAIWGSGKSTFIKLVESSVTKKIEFKNSPLEGWQPKVDGVFLWLVNFIKSIFNLIFNLPHRFLQWSGLGYKQGKNEVIWIDFDPWNYTASEKLIADFFDTLENRISQIYGNGFDKTVGKYVNLLVSGKPSFLGLDFNFEFNPLKQDQDLGVLKGKISERLRNVKEKIVIVIDDIDRLPPEMVLTVLRLVGITANFPNIIFVLAMDYDKVEQIVQKELGEQYQNYLQKIVNERVKLEGWSYNELCRIFYFYTKEAVDKFLNSEGLKTKIKRRGLLQFENAAKKIHIFENYMVRSFCKGFQASIEEVYKKGELKNTSNEKKLGWEYKNELISDESKYFSHKKNRNLRFVTDKKLVSPNPIIAIGQRSIFKNKLSLKDIKDLKFSSNKKLFDLITKNLHEVKESRFSISDITSVHQTPRDIKQLANNYIYEVAKIYDSFDRNSKAENDFPTQFINRLQEELPIIVKETVKKQMFSLT